MARAPEIQIFACPACAKLYKRRVDVWVDLQHPRPPSSPSVQIPRICVCGRVFLLSESTVIANLPGDGGRSRSHNSLSEYGMDRMDIPAFLRKRDDSEEALSSVQPKEPQAIPQPTSKQRNVFARITARLFERFKPKTEPEPKTKKGAVQSVLWEMEAIALPEKIAPTR